MQVQPGMLLLLPPEILSALAKEVAEQDTHADGDILALSSSCHSLNVIARSEANKFLETRRKYRNLMLVGRSEIMLDLLLQILAGENFHWHVRSVKVHGLKTKWSEQERMSATSKQYRDKLRNVMPMLRNSGLGVTFAEKIPFGLEAPLLALLLLHLPRLQSIEPAFYADDFMRQLAEGRFRRTAFPWLSPLISSMEPLKIDYSASQELDARMISRSNGAIFAGQSDYSHVPAADASRRLRWIHSVEFGDFHMSPEDLSKLMPQFLSARKISISHRRQTSPCDYQTICKVLMSFLGYKLTDLTLITKFENLGCCIETLVTFSELRRLKVDSRLLAVPDSYDLISLMELLPQSIETISITNCRVQESGVTARSLFTNFKASRFPHLFNISLVFDTKQGNVMQQCIKEIQNGLRLLSVDFRALENQQDGSDAVDGENSKREILLSLLMLSGDRALNNTGCALMSIPRRDLARMLVETTEKTVKIA